MATAPIDLRSDTLTKPSAEMLKAMAQADFGDDCYGESSTIRELEDYCADLFGKEAGLLMPSGTMSNQVALKSLMGRGQEILCDADYHLNFFEASPTTDLGGASINALSTKEGFLTPEAAEEGMANRARWSSAYAETRLLWTENTINGRGGRIHPLPLLRELRGWSSRRGIPIFLDGARIMNAVAATNVSPAEWGQEVDAMSMCFAKGLGAPMGSVLIGSRDFIRTARNYRKWYGGALHQSGPIAAAAMWALKNNITRLPDDHENAKRFASILSQNELVSVSRPDTNIVIFDIGKLGCSPTQFVEMAGDTGVRILVWRKSEIRAVFSLDISINQALTAAHTLSRLAVKIGQRKEFSTTIAPA